MWRPRGRDATAELAAGACFQHLSGERCPSSCCNVLCYLQCDEDVTSIMFIVPNDHDRIKGLYRR